MRESGVPLPEGNDDADLRRLSALIERHGTEFLFLLGDIVHGATTPDSAWRTAWQAFVSAHAGVRIRAILGNHDRHDRAALAGSAGILAKHSYGAIDLCHHPVARASGEAQGKASERFTVCGHLHPLALVRDGALRLRLPCFWLQETQIVLPAFGSTTRGQVIVAEPRDRVIAVTPAGLLEVPSQPSPVARWR